MNFARGGSKTEFRGYNNRSRTNTLGSVIAGQLFFRRDWASHISPAPPKEVPASRHVREIVCDASLSPQEMISVFEWCLERGMTVRVPAEALGNVASFLPKRYRDGRFLVFRCGRAKKVQRLTKRTVDVIASLIGLVAFLPLFMVTAMLICLESEGSPMFVQDRIGIGGHSFKLWKFRSMFRNTNAARHLAFMTAFVGEKSVPEMDVGNFKLVERPEVTRVGRFLRRSSFDELPQLLNVLRGEMSLVGPRPVPVYEAELYDEWHHRRHRVRPGITGLWQVYARSRVPFNEMMLLDVIYAYNWSIALDVRLLLNTLPAAIRGTGAF